MIDDFDQILMETIRGTEDLLKLDDVGWLNLSQSTTVIPSSERKSTVTKARIFSLKDPLATRSVRLMTDYSFGGGMSWNSKDERVTKSLSLFWDSQDNKGCLSPIGQRKSSDRLLVDGEIFFALFLGSAGQATMRRIDPLEVTEIITDPDDIDDVRFYKREWVNQQGASKITYYRSFTNEKNVATPDSMGVSVQSNDDALVFQVAINDTWSNRGNSYLLPALQWIDLYRRFLAARAAVALAAAKFIWKLKVQGGAAAVASAKGALNEQEIKAGSTQIENMGADLQPIRTDTGAPNAYQDGRMLKLQVSAATGWPEQYFGDISIGNLATAKTVELPVMKMCQSYQTLWKSVYETIDDKVMEHVGIPEDKMYVDRDFPDITPEDSQALALSIQQMAMTFPEMTGSRDVLQRALLAIGIQNTNEVLDQIMSEVKSMPEVKVAKALREFREVIGNGHKGIGQ